MKLKTLISAALATVLAVSMLTGCSSSSSGTQTTSTGVAHVYYSLVDSETKDSGVGVYQDYALVVNEDNTYVLYNNYTMDITQASGGYISDVGGATISIGTWTLTEEDGETVYTLSEPTRVIKSNYMMLGISESVTIYVDSADSSTYANYSPEDITGYSESEVIQTLYKVNYAGVVDESVSYISTVAVDTSTFLITNIG